MSDRSDFWYRLGYALESARRGQTRASLDAMTGSTSVLRRKDDRSRPRKPGAGGRGERTDVRERTEDGAGEPDGSGALDLLLAAGTGTVVSRLLSAWPARRRPTLARLVRAAAAGAGATLLRELLDPLLKGEARLPTWDDAMGERLTAGVARGLIYGGVLDPRLPGPAAARGATYGAAEYLLSPWGGLRSLVGKHAPYRKLPVVSTLLDDPETGEEAFLDHLVFGVALALLYGEGDDLRIGIGDDDV